MALFALGLGALTPRCLDSLSSGLLLLPMSIPLPALSRAPCAIQASHRALGLVGAGRIVGAQAGLHVIGDLAPQEGDTVTQYLLTARYWALTSRYWQPDPSGRRTGVTS
jgi:hypothetical protein